MNAVLAFAANYIFTFKRTCIRLQPKDSVCVTTRLSGTSNLYLEGKPPNRGEYALIVHMICKCYDKINVSNLSNLFEQRHEENVILFLTSPVNCCSAFDLEALSEAMGPVELQAGTLKRAEHSLLFWN